MATFTSLLKAIPGIVALINAFTSGIEKLYKMYKDYQLGKIEKHYNNKVEAKTELTKRVENAATDEERVELVKRLNNLLNS